VEAIRKAVPFGKNTANVMIHEGDFRLLLEFGIAGLEDVTNKSGSFWGARIEAEEESDARKTEGDGSILSNSSSVSHHAIERGQNQLGTIGDTGHTIDIQMVEGVFDEKAGERLGLFRDQLVVTFSAGSRDFGHQVTEEYMKLAREFSGDKAPERVLSFFEGGSPEAESYVHALGCAANFAFVNRQIMTALIRNAVRTLVGKKAMPLICDVPYNTLRHETHRQRKVWVHRRGATKALFLDEVELREPGSAVVISGSPMGASYILCAGEKCDLTLKSLSVISSYAITDKDSAKSKRGRSKQRSVDEVVRCLVDSGLAKILARLKGLATIPG
jgi:tRNA-splicing ligase RtcB